jgi:competence protein ComEC
VTRLVGRVAAHPRGAAAGDVVEVRAEWIHENGVPRPARGRWRVFRRSPGRPWAWGDRVAVEGVPRPDPDGSGGVLWTLPGRDRLVERALMTDPRRWMSAARAACRDAYARRLGPDHAPLMAGIVLGDRPPRDSRLADDFRRSGTLHLLVASGTNVGFVVALWWALARWGMWWPRKAVLATVPAVAYFYAGVAGNDPPVLRAAFMVSFVAVAALIGRWDRPLRVLFVSGVVLALARPGVLFQPGFQMSYAATASIVWAWPRRDHAEPTPRGRGPWRRLARFGLVGLVPQIALAPFLLHDFGRFSWVGIFSNIVAVPLAEIALGLGALLGFLHTVWPAAAGVVALPTEWVLWALAAWTRACACLPGAEWTRPLSLAGALVVGGGVFMAFVAPRVGRRGKWFFSAATVLVTVGLWAGAERPPTLRLRWQGGRARTIAVTQGADTYVLRVSTTGAGPLWGKGDGRGFPGVFHRPTGPGYAFEIAAPSGRVWVAVGLSRAQQKALLMKGLPRVEILGWTPAGRGPPTDEFLKALSPRWIVYQGPRLPKAVRAMDPPASVHRAGAAGFTIEEREGGFRLSGP